MTTRFAVPTDDQWNERPRGGASRLSLSLGWTILLVWVVGILGFVIAEIWSGPEDWTAKLLAFGGLSGLALVFLSVLLDRLRTRRSDRYREVRK